MLVDDLVHTRCNCSDPFKSQLAHSRSVRSQLVESVRRVHGLVAALREDGHLSEEEQQSINSQPTLTDRAHLLLHTLVNKPPQAYQCFLDALLSTNQTHLYCLLTDRGTVRVTYKGINKETGTWLAYI